MEESLVDIFWRKYKFFPYEKQLGLREIKSLLNPNSIYEYDDRLRISASINPHNIKKLVYFSHAEINKDVITTFQSLIERKINSKNQQKQNTRYSVHGLHEYKGKFNPQIVRVLFNIFNIDKGKKIIDPFCGSGTTLVEAAHMGIHAIGTDINPMASFVANAKIAALNIGFSSLCKEKDRIIERFKKPNNSPSLNIINERDNYLRSWFPRAILNELEFL
jgi:DNA modification methylase